MAWTIQDRFPTWGETGESPPDGFFYDGGDQVNEKHLDYLWDSIKELEDDVQNALNDIDSDGDGIVDKADVVSGTVSFEDDLVASDGEVIWDESEGYIPQPRLENSTITLNSGDGLKNGSTAALGGSFSLDIEPADFAGDGVKEDASDNIAIEPADFAGSGLNDDGADNIELTDDSVTVAGNSVSLGGSTGIALGDLSNVTATGEGSGNGLNADQVDGQDYSDIQNWVNNNADVPNADFADTAGEVNSVDWTNVTNKPNTTGSENASTSYKPLGINGESDGTSQSFTEKADGTYTQTINITSHYSNGVYADGVDLNVSGVDDSNYRVEFSDGTTESISTGGSSITAGRVYYIRFDYTNTSLESGTGSYSYRLRTPDLGNHTHNI